MTDVRLLIFRSLRSTLRTPAAVIPNIAISVFFLFVYNSGLSSVANLPGFGGSYLGFILPVSVVSAAVGGAGLAGQSLVRDLESGYFTKLLLTPANRLGLIWGPMFAGAAVLVVQVVLIVGLGLLLGLRSATGVAGLAFLVFLAFLWGMAFAGYAAFMALRTRNAAAAQAATFAFFPLIFLSATFVPREFLGAGWLRVAATVNPTTYVFEAMRAVLMRGWEAGPVLRGVAVVTGFASLTGTLALLQARRTAKEQVA
jgi:ABC-2 type transport system permease protein